MALFSVNRTGNRTTLVIEAAALAGADGWLVFESVDGEPLATLPAVEVLGLETVGTATPSGRQERATWFPR